MKPNRLAGHTLPNEGRVRDAAGWLGNGPGRARCSCGERSPNLSSTAARKLWHRDHKDDIRNGGDGRVWRGVRA